MAEVTVNGERRELPEPATVVELVTGSTAQTRGVAVAVNGEVVPRAGWSTTVLRDGDRVEVLTAAQGG
ncbi:sulfur carrier protein ThiS [Micromonospora sonneratiae]|uniref:Sulfur carrier protein ThiS n=1 Tax=Micromonospora sonneratiae TaxID=1184706 RepID=A0ABW3YIQ2_9ACTN